ncbi:MAG: helix-turn-helix domain-containing protein [Pseudomonadota bacterium]
MQININSPRELGLLIRATRKAQKLRLDDVAGSAGVGHVFVRDVERGKETVQLGRVMKLLAELGITLSADVSHDVAPVLATLKLKGVKPLRPRRKSADPGNGKEDPT